MGKALILSNNNKQFMCLFIIDTFKQIKTHILFPTISKRGICWARGLTAKKKIILYIYIYIYIIFFFKAMGRRVKKHTDAYAQTNTCIQTNRSQQFCVNANCILFICSIIYSHWHSEYTPHCSWSTASHSLNTCTHVHTVITHIWLLWCAWTNTDPHLHTDTQGYATAV